jgi:arsenite methyltransferase
LKPGGRLAVSDIVVRGTVPVEVRKSMELWAGCIAGALEEGEYRATLGRAGFDGIEIVPTRVYTLDDARNFLAGAGLDVESVAQHIQDRFMSAFVRARKAAPAK